MAILQITGCGSRLPMDTVRPRCTRVKPGKGAHSGNYYKLPQIGRMGAIEELS